MGLRGLRVELLWWEGCPSIEPALALLRDQMSALGLDPDAVAVREVRTAADAEREGFVGSPTIRVEGRDIEPPGAEPVGLSCRVYRTADGGVSPLPEQGSIRAALAAGLDEVSVR